MGPPPPPLVSKVILKCNSQIHFILFNLFPFLLNQLGIMYLKLRKREGGSKESQSFPRELSKSDDPKYTVNLETCSVTGGVVGRIGERQRTWSQVLCSVATVEPFLETSILASALPTAPSTLKNSEDSVIPALWRSTLEEHSRGVLVAPPESWNSKEGILNLAALYIQDQRRRFLSPSDTGFRLSNQCLNSFVPPHR